MAALCAVCGLPLHDNACQAETPEQKAARLEKAAKVAVVIGKGLAAALREAQAASERRIAEREVK